MIVGCPFCQARYELSADLIGPAGARILCPACAHTFVVDPAGQVVGDDAPAAAPGPAADEPTRIARALVASLADRRDAMIGARDRGRLFTEWGSVLLDLFAEYRRQAGGEADPVPFREALRGSIGVDLPEGDGA